VSLIGLGGHHIGRQKEEKESITIIRAAIDAGVNFMDNCWDYHDGGSEIRMGKALRDGYRKKVFLMTKIDGRTRKAAAEQLDQCLTRLRTDVIDLLQFHEVLRLEDPDRIFAEGGAMEAVLAARKGGKSASSASLATRTRWCICGCSTWRRCTNSASTRCRCRSTSWTPTSAVSPTRSCPCWCATRSACWA
jgi:aryl-alcohol dehydrogenase-like predicted oxidoreductase